MTQGRTACINGKHFEQKIANEFKINGFKIVTYKDFYNNRNNWHNTFGRKIIITNYPYRSIYSGCKARTEYMIMFLKHDGSVFRFPIECKIQNTPGTVDEKFAFLILNCLYREEDKIVIILEGEGARKGAKKFLNNGWKQKFPSLYDKYKHKKIIVTDYNNLNKIIQKINLLAAK